MHHAYVLSSAITAEVVLPGDPPAAGQSYSLMCTVTGAGSLNPTINYMYQWFKTTPSRTQVGTNSPTLTFDPLVLSDTGHYNCEVTITSNQLTQDVMLTSNDYEIRFGSEYTSNISSMLIQNSSSIVPVYYQFVQSRSVCDESWSLSKEQFTHVSIR